MTDTELSVPPRMALPLATVRRILADLGTKAYLVGGVVRDMLLGRTTADIDIAVAGDALDVASRVAGRLDGKYVLLDDTNRVARVIKTAGDTSWQFDFSSLQGTIEQDLARRDFTINALAVDIADLAGEPARAGVIDHSDGAGDLDRRIVRAVRETVFEADPVRLLRAVRLAAELGFTIESRTEWFIRRSAQLVTGVPGERVREELLRLLAIPGKDVLSGLDGLGLLTRLVPELEEARGVSQLPEHFWDVLDHIMQTVAAVDCLLRKATWEHAPEELVMSAPWSDALAQHFAEPVSGGSDRRIILKVAALFHDIAKPRTRTEFEGRTRFLGHGPEGAAIAVSTLERLRFSAREIRLVEVMVLNHLRPTQMSNIGLPSARAIYRYFRDTGDAGIDILFLSLADHLATRGPELSPAGWQEHVGVVEYVLKQRLESRAVVAPPKLIDGHDLMNVFMLRPGPRIGELLEAVREAQAAGEVTDREGALAFVRNRLSSSK